MTRTWRPLFLDRILERGRLIHLDGLGPHASPELRGGLAGCSRTCQNFRNSRARISGTHKSKGIQAPGVHDKKCATSHLTGRLLKEVFGYQDVPSTRTVDNHILSLRQKLEKDPSDPVHFRTVRHVGYSSFRNEAPLSVVYANAAGMHLWIELFLGY